MHIQGSDKVNIRLRQDKTLRLDDHKQLYAWAKTTRKNQLAQTQGLVNANIKFSLGEYKSNYLVQVVKKIDWK